MLDNSNIVTLRGIVTFEAKDTNSDITTDFIREVLSGYSSMVGAKPGSDGFEEIVRILETQLDISQDIGHSISASDFKKWWDDRKSTGIDLHYWNRLNQFMLQQGELPPTVINVLDRTTDEILDYAGDPIQEGSWRRRGMVIGHVQSGKTSNYSALICKAADAGYRVIILLAGITNSLRKQTQERINYAFIGKHATEMQNVRQEVIGAALHSAGNPKHPDYGTTLSKDFILSSAIAQAGHQIQNKTEPVIFVCKKNVSTLKNLNKYFENAFDKGMVPLPLLLIDDEADNASINTNASQSTITAINKNIRSLLSKFIKSSYVGYTATPFANIFIDPITTEEMENDDLFPSDFIKSLDAPSNYVGPDRLFGQPGDLAETMLVHVSDHEDVLPTNHKVDHIVPVLPDSLLTAIRTFILSKALRMYRGDAAKHCTMMVNVSRFNAVQQQLEGLIYQYLEKLKADFFINSQNWDPQNSKIMAEVKFTFETEFKLKIEKCPNWEDLKTHLYPASSVIKVRQINMAGKEGLDYDNYSEDGLSIIAVGGLALSRGLTLEGLTVSYVLRNAAASDTLMQMGRWFGYRPNYEDLCRLFIPKQSIHFYQEITESVSELRNEVKLMEDYGATPSEFGLKVRESPAAIRITAANKMRSAEKITVSLGFAGKTIEGHSLRPHNDNKGNLNYVETFLSNLGAPKQSLDIFSQELFWPDVSKNEVLQFLRSFKVSPYSKELFVRSKDGSSLVADYIFSANKDFKKWDVCINNVLSRGETQKSISLNGWSLIPRIRHKGWWLNNKIYNITGNRGVSSGGDAAYGLLKSTKAKLEKTFGNSTTNRLFNEERNENKPLLMIYLLDCKPSIHGENIPSGPIVSYNVSFPSQVFNKQIKREYQANVVYQQLEMDLGYQDDAEGIEALVNE